MNMIHFINYDHVTLTYPYGQESVLRKFYGDVLGLEEIIGNHPNESIWFKMGNKEIHFVVEQMGPLSRRHVAFEVQDLNHAKEYLHGQGIEITFSSKIEGRDRFFGGILSEIDWNSLYMTNFEMDKSPLLSSKNIST